MQKAIDLANNPSALLREQNFSRYVELQTALASMNPLLPDLMLDEGSFTLIKPRCVVEAGTGDALSRLPKGILSQFEITLQAYYTDTWLRYLEQGKPE